MATLGHSADTGESRVVRSWAEITARGCWPDKRCIVLSADEAVVLGFLFGVEVTSELDFLRCAARAALGGVMSELLKNISDA